MLFFEEPSSIFANLIETAGVGMDTVDDFDVGVWIGVVVNEEAGLVILNKITDAADITSNDRKTRSGSFKDGVRNTIDMGSIEECVILFGVKRGETVVGAVIGES